MAVNPYPNDPVNDGISETIGAQVMPNNASGLEKALADVDAQRLTAVYAELTLEQWRPYEISSRNLPFLAWALGCNLWEDWWSDEFRRYWVAQQWTLKKERGSLPGLKRFVRAVGGEVMRVVRPPARFYGLSEVSDISRVLESLVPSAKYYGKLTNTRVSYEALVWQDTRDQPTWDELKAADRAAYVARFPQLRVYPWIEVGDDPWNCFCGRPQANMALGSPPLVPNKNGYFAGPLRPFYPTAPTLGHSYTHIAKLWDRGVETDLTVRKITTVETEYIAYDEEIILTLKYRLCFFETSFLSGGKNYGIFPHRARPYRTFIIRRSGPQLWEGKAIYQTASPSATRILLEPEIVATRHPIRPTELYGCRTQYLHGKFFPQSNAWQFMYERWYLFDADRVPDMRKNSIYMGRARFGIPKYTAEALIHIPAKSPRFIFNTASYCYGYMRKPNNEPIERLRRGVRASMALRDTVLIDTRTMRRLQVRDLIDLDGGHTVGEWVQA